MKTITFTYSCSNCNTRFSAPGFSDFSYGHFILFSIDGLESAYLDATSDIVFEELGKLVEEHPTLRGIENGKMADIIQKAFTITCDLSLTGESFHIGGRPVCPNCGSRKMNSWEPTFPQSFVEIPEVSHKYWNTLEQSKKKALVDNFLNSTNPQKRT